VVTHDLTWRELETGEITVLIHGESRVVIERKLTHGHPLHQDAHGLDHLGVGRVCYDDIVFPNCGDDIVGGGQCRIIAVPEVLNRRTLGVRWIISPVSARRASDAAGSVAGDYARRIEPHVVVVPRRGVAVCHRRERTGAVHALVGVEPGAEGTAGNRLNALWV
jgi:hypothetical protein